MEKHWLRKSPSINGMPSQELHDRNYRYGPTSAPYRQHLNGSSGPETTYATSYQAPPRDPHSDRQHLQESSNGTYGNEAPDTYYDNRHCYGSSAASSTSHYGGCMLETRAHEDSLKSMTSGYRLDPGYHGQSSRYSAARSPTAGPQKPVHDGYYCDGPGGNAYSRNEPIAGTDETQRWVPSSRLDGAIDRTLEDWCHLIKNIGCDVPNDKLAQMLLDTPDASMMSKRNESQMNSTFQPLGYSVIDRDEQSYRARNLKSNDITFEGIEPSNISWRISPEDSISLFKSRAINETTNRRADGLSTESEENEELSVLYRTSDLMDQIKGFPSDISGCDMADLLLPPPNGKSTKERLAMDSSDFSVPNISDINSLLKAGLSSEELINELLDGRNSYPRNSSRNSLPVGRNSYPRSSSRNSLPDGRASPSRSPTRHSLDPRTSDTKKPDVCRSPPQITDRATSPRQLGRKSSSHRSDRPTSPRRTLQWQKDVHESAEKKTDTFNSSDESFVPMSYSIINQDEESILKKYQMANDITLHGIENSNISWQLNPGEISLFKELGKSISKNRSFLRPIGEGTLLEDQTSEKPQRKS